ncbi:MAG: PPC domain-containing protein [Planctomyces sp.]|nr:PPC domain-containing protein [Planctomyces sp.]
MRVQSLLATTCGLFLLAAASPALAVNPRLQQVLPHGGQRGTESTLTLRGTGLEDAEELMLYDEGLEVVSLTVPEDGQRRGRELEIVVRIRPDCPLGSQRFRLRTATGLSNLLCYWVGTLPVIEEQEPNSDFREPQVLTPGVTVHGQITSEDVDYFAFDARQGERINVEVVGLRLGASAGNGGEYFDPYIAILDSNRFELEASDDTPLFWNDPIISFVPPADGRYVIQLRDVAYGGDQNAYYLMHVGRFPRPAAIFPLGGRPGDSLNITFLGDAAGVFEQPFVVPTDGRELALVEAADEFGVAPSAHPFRVSALESVNEQEPNNTREEATPAPAPGAWNGQLAEPGDVDLYRFTASKGQVLNIQVYARKLRSAADTVLTIYNASGAQLAENDDNREPDSALRFNVPEDGEYFAQIRDHLGGGGPAMTYRVEVTTVSPRLTATTVEPRQYVQPTLVVPQGGAIGVQLNIGRQDTGGPVALLPENLPDGVTVELPEDWRGDATVPVIVRAAEDAPMAGRWSTLGLRTGDPDQPDSLVHGLVSQQILLVRGQNNLRVWEERQDRLPIVVTKPAPFKVRLEPPKAPIVQGGSLPLKVVIERAEGFNDPVRVLLLQNAPGCSSANATEIAAGETEAVIPVNAAANAPMRMSHVAVRAISRNPNQRRGMRGGGGGGGERRAFGGSYEIASNWVPLRVEGPHLKFEFRQAVVKQGQETFVHVDVEKLRDFDGEADVTLVGLPANCEAEPLKFTSDQKELKFKVTAAADAPIGQTKNLLCQVNVPVNGEPVPCTLGAGRLRVDPAPQDAPVAAAEAPASDAPPPASRLDQLRQEQTAREAAQAGEAESP